MLRESLTACLDFLKNGIDWQYVGRGTQQKAREIIYAVGKTLRDTK